MATLYNPKIVTDGLVLCLDAANPKSYPGSGNSCFDLISNENCSLDNGTTYSSENKGHFLFDGSNDTITLPTTTILANSFSVSCFIKTSVAGDKKVYSIAISYHPIQIFTGGYLRVCINGCTVGTNTVVTDNIWRMITTVGNTDSIRLYINDNETPEITQSQNNVEMSGTPRLGATGVGFDSYYYSGIISNIIQYNRALTDSEIKQNFNALRGRYGI